MIGVSRLGRQAVLLDAMGTLLRLEDPAPRLRAALVARLGLDVGAEAAAAAVRAEIAYYRAHLHLGRDPASLAELRADAAGAMRPALPPPADGAPGAELTAALLDALAFTPFPDAAPALRALRDAGCTLVVVSNWDFSLHERLEETGLAPLVDGAVASAELGAAKPERAIFERALELAGVPAERAWHVGDSIREDVEGARAAGIRAVLVARDERAIAPRDRGDDRSEESVPPAGAARAADAAGEARPPAGGGGRRRGDVPVLRSLDGLPGIVAGGDPYAVRP